MAGGPCPTSHATSFGVEWPHLFSRHLGNLEGKGWLAIAEEAVAFEGEVAQWHALGHPYDEARALSGLNKALDRTGDESRALAAAERGLERVNALASARAREPAAGAG